MVHKNHKQPAMRGLMAVEPHRSPPMDDGMNDEESSEKMGMSKGIMLLKSAITRHKGHMEKTEPLTNQSQQKLMEEMEQALTIFEQMKMAE